MTISPLLTLWRTQAADALHARPGLAEELVALVLERMVPNSEDERRLADRAARAGTRVALLALARALGGDAPHRSDDAMSLMLAAALQGAQPAALALVQALLTCAQENGPLPRRQPSGDAAAGRPAPLSEQAPGLMPRGQGFAMRRLIRVALSWSPEVDLAFLTRLDPWGREAGRPGDPEPAPGSPLWQGAQGGAPRPDRGPPSLIVVRAIGDAESLDGEEVARLYGRLTAPLPLQCGETEPGLVAAALAIEFPHLVGAIEPVIQDLRLRWRAGVRPVYLRPLLLVGPPGVRKTRFAKVLARRLDVGYGELSGAEASDDRMLRGTARGWRNAQPALPLLVMLQSGCANPLILVDELDKAGGSERNGDIRHTLLPLLERETAQSRFDECLLAPCDLSQVSWVSTANEIGALPGRAAKRPRSPWRQPFRSTCGRRQAARPEASERAWGFLRRQQGYRI